MNGLLTVLKAILTLFAKSADSSQTVSEKKESPVILPNPKQLLGVNDFITSSGKYPERLRSSELTQDVLENIQTLSIHVNAFLSDLGVTKAKISSGFRPSDVNSALPNSAKKSLHMKGLAVDLEDADGSLDALIESRDDLKKKHGLWQESPASTKGWAHIDIGSRSPREKNTFLP